VFSRESGSLTQLIAALGAKFLVANRFLVTGSVLVSLNTGSGLIDRFVPVIGLEYAWTRQ
jgi:hypothetical protein